MIEDQQFDQDPHYPNVDIDFIEQQMNRCEKVIDSITIGNTTIFRLSGVKNGAIQVFILRHTPDKVVNYHFATATAYKFRFFPALMDWLELNRSWKEGGYTK